MMTFWETVRGVRLADTLISCLPKLTEEKKQFTVRVASSEAAAKVEELIAKGKRYVDQIQDGTEVVLVFEEEA